MKDTVIEKIESYVYDNKKTICENFDDFVFVGQAEDVDIGMDYLLDYFIFTIDDILQTSEENIMDQYGKQAYDFVNKVKEDFPEEYEYVSILKEPTVFALAKEYSQNQEAKKL